MGRIPIQNFNNYKLLRKKNNPLARVVFLFKACYNEIGQLIIINLKT